MHSGFVFHLFTPYDDACAVSPFTSNSTHYMRTIVVHNNEAMKALVLLKLLNNFVNLISLIALSGHPSRITRWFAVMEKLTDILCSMALPTGTPCFPVRSN